MFIELPLAWLSSLFVHFSLQWRWPGLSTTMRMWQSGAIRTVVVYYYTVGQLDGVNHHFTWRPMETGTTTTSLHKFKPKIFNCDSIYQIWNNEFFISFFFHFPYSFKHVFIHSFQTMWCDTMPNVRKRWSKHGWPCHHECLHVVNFSPWQFWTVCNNTHCTFRLINPRLFPLH